jgi:hypothetical protein
MFTLKLDKFYYMSFHIAFELTKNVRIPSKALLCCIYHTVIGNL